MRVITSLCVVIISEGVVLPLWAWLYLCRSGFSFVGMVLTFVGVVLPFSGVVLSLLAWVYLCCRDFTFVDVVLPL